MNALWCEFSLPEKPQQTRSGLLPWAVLTTRFQQFLPLQPNSDSSLSNIHLQYLPMLHRCGFATSVILIVRRMSFESLHAQISRECPYKTSIQMSYKRRNSSSCALHVGRGRMIKPSLTDSPKKRRWMKRNGGCILGRNCASGSNLGMFLD